MVFLGSHVLLRPFLRHEIDACHRLRVPVDTAVALCTSAGVADAPYEAVANVITREPGYAKAAVLDVRDKRVKSEVTCTECYFGDDGLRLAAKDLVEEIVVDYLTGRDVSVMAFGARMAGKTQLLFGDLQDPSEEAAVGGRGAEVSNADDSAPLARTSSTGNARHPSAGDECVVIHFAEQLWRAIGVEEDHRVMLSAVQVMPDGVSLNLLGDAEEVGSYDSFASTFVGPVQGTDALRQVLANTFYNLQQVRHVQDASMGSVGTTIFSLRVDRSTASGATGGAHHSQNSPIAMFVEAEPMPPACTSPLAKAIRALGELNRGDAGFASPTAITANGGGVANGGSTSGSPGGAAVHGPFDDLPWGVLLVLEALRARSWSTKVVCCTSPSPTASTASANHIMLAKQLEPPARALSASPPNCGRKITVEGRSGGAGNGVASTASSVNAADAAVAAAGDDDVHNNNNNNNNNANSSHHPHGTAVLTNEHAGDGVDARGCDGSGDDAEGVAAPLPSRDVAEVLAMPSDPPSPEAAPRTRPPPTWGAGGGGAGGASAWAGAQTPLELSHMVSKLKAEIATLQREFSGERLRYIRQADEKDTRILALESNVTRLEHEKEALAKENDDLKVKAELAANEAKTLRRTAEVQRREAKGLEYENQALHRQVDAFHRRAERAKEAAAENASNAQGAGGGAAGLTNARTAKVPYPVVGGSARRTPSSRSLGAGDTANRSLLSVGSGADRFSRQQTLQAPRRASMSGERHSRTISSTFAGPTQSSTQKITAQRSFSARSGAGAGAASVGPAATSTGRTRSPNFEGVSRVRSLVGASATYARPKLSNSSPNATPNITPRPAGAAGTSPGSGLRGKRTLRSGM